VVDDNTVTNTEISQEQQDGSETTPIVKVPPIESRFLFVDVAALRAKQLRRGARVRLPAPADGELPAERPHKAERVAMEEVKQGLVSYDLVDPNKLEGEGQ
jgi:DNA-directed RNA polymerase subunit K/omega